MLPLVGYGLGVDDGRAANQPMTLVRLAAFLTGALCADVFPDEEVPARARLILDGLFAGEES